MTLYRTDQGEKKDPAEVPGLVSVHHSDWYREEGICPGGGCDSEI